MCLLTANSGLSEAHRTGERWLVPELYRGKAQVLADKAGMVEAEKLLQVAIEAARALETSGWELRAVRDLAWLWAEQGKRAQAHNLLASVWFRSKARAVQSAAVNLFVSSLYLGHRRGIANLAAMSYRPSID